MAEKKVSYGAKLIKIPLIRTKCFDDTIDIYQDACEFIANVVLEHWDEIKELGSLKNKEHAVEALIHATKSNPNPQHSEFDKLFHKFPSYLRRSAIDEAIGSVSSYKSNLKNYEKERYEHISSGKKFKKKPPTFNPRLGKYPTLFKKNMFERIDSNTVKIKVFKNNDWVWVECGLRNQDVKYILKNCANMEELSPSLRKSGQGFKLSFVFKKKVDFDEHKNIFMRKILAVDLGVNTSAVCSVMNGEGTILGRKFIDMPIEKDLMYRLINRVSKLQKQSGCLASLKKIWNKIDNYKTEITNKVVNAIINYALEQKVDVIVFERLGVMKLRGYGAKRNRKKVHHWNKRTIIKKACAKAHTFGIRYSVVNPRNTSALAFDGSGKVERYQLKSTNTKKKKRTASLCKFTTGKKYNSDLNASYNIGARYFIREAKKSASESAWLECQAKCPDILIRTNTTLASYISLVKVLKAA